MKIGFIGLGIMGAPMAQHLLAAGHEMFVRTRSKVPEGLQGAKVCATNTEVARSADVITRVRFRNLPDAELQAYLHAEQPYDVAGSAKSEGLGIALLEAVHSDDPTALVGLPLIALTGMLIEAGYPLFAPS